MSFVMMRRVWDSSRHNGAAFTVLLALADYADDDGLAFPSVETLARKARLSERSTQYALTQLRKSGEIDIEAGGGRHRTHQYRVRLSETVQRLHPITQAETVQATTETPQSLHPTPPETVQTLHPNDPERVQSTTERVQTTVRKGAKSAPEPSVTTRSTVSTPRNKQQKSLEVEEIYAHFRAKIQPASRTCADDKIRARLKTFSVSELKQGIDNFAANPWSMKHNAHRGTGWFFANDARSEMYLSMRPDTEVDEDAALNGHAPSAPHVNGTASPLIPATDDDRAVWDRALTVVQATMNRSNFEAYVAPLAVAGRVDDGGLCLIVPADVGEHLKTFRHHISRALEDAGDQHPAAVRFKARKPREQTDAE